EDELAVAADGRGRDEDLVREEVAEESSDVTRLVDAEAAEHLAVLPAPQEEEDHQRHGEQQHRPPADDDGVAEEQQDQAGYPHEDDADVEEGHEVVDSGDELGEHAWLGPRGMGAKA